MRNRPCCLMILTIIFSVFLAACGSDHADKTPLKTPLILWHSWDEKETAVLHELLNKFMVVYPDIHVIQAAFPPDKLAQEFSTQARLGLGADIVMLPNSAVLTLAQSGLIQPIDERVDPAAYLSAALNTLRYGGRLYGLPLSLRTTALYYNRALVNAPPKTLPELLEQAADGKSVGLNSSFYAAFWGIQAFGGQMFDEDGRVILNQGGFANWLSWLKKAQQSPNVILTNDPATLRSMFLKGQLAYYADRSELLPSLQQELGENVVGVAPFPAGTGKPSGPILETEALLLNAASSDEQAALALKLAQFLTNFEQQSELIRQLRRVPANSRVWVDPRIYPAVAGFSAQARTAVALPNLPQAADIESAGNDAYIQALSGVFDPQKAATMLTEQMNARYGFETVQAAAVCAAAGTLRVWYIPKEMNSTVLEGIRERFIARCPGVAIELEPFEADEHESDSDSRLREEYRAAEADGNAPDMLIGSNHLTAMLAADGALQDLNDFVDADVLQRYIPETLEAMSYDGKLYALPVSIMQLMALYYNAELAADPPLSLDDLLYQADAGRKAVLPLSNFYYAYWGLGAFGAKLFDDDYRVILDRGGFAEWLEWLNAAKAHDNIRLLLSEDLETAKTLFAEGKAAYFAGEITQLSELQAALGAERVRVAPLPSGAKGKSSPILGVQGVMLRRASDDAQRRAALEFAMYLAEVESQTALMEQANQAPANVNVDMSSYPAIAGFVEQARSAAVPPIVPQIEPVFFWGVEPYLNVLNRGFQPKTAVEHAVNLINKVNGVPTDAAPVICPPEAQSQLTIWQAADIREDILPQVLARFAQSCPGITTETMRIPAEALLERLSTAAKAGNRPDVILASHTLMHPLRQADLIQDLRPMFEESVIIRFLSGILGELSVGKALYGLPLNCRAMGLFYNTTLASEPATMEELLAASVAIPTDLQSAFWWGIPLFGGLLEYEGGELRLDDAYRQSAADWLRWLNAAKQHSGVIFDRNPAALRRMFAAGKLAYLIAESDALPEFRRALGRDAVGVALLPNEAEPFMQVDAFFISSGIDDAQTKVAAAFAQFATSDAMQTALMKESRIVPANELTLAGLDDPTLANLSEMARYSRMPDAAMMAKLIKFRERAYEDLFTDTQTPEEAAQTLLDMLAQP